jgi:hypothetical protein
MPQLPHQKGQQEFLPTTERHFCVAMGAQNAHNLINVTNAKRVSLWIPIHQLAKTAVKIADNVRVLMPHLALLALEEVTYQEPLVFLVALIALLVMVHQIVALNVNLERFSKTEAVQNVLKTVFLVLSTLIAQLADQDSPLKPMENVLNACQNAVFVIQSIPLSATVALLALKLLTQFVNLAPKTARLAKMEPVPNVDLLSS